MNPRRVDASVCAGKGRLHRETQPEQDSQVLPNKGGRGQCFLHSANALKTGNASRITQAPTRNSEGKVGQASEMFLFFK